MLFFRVWLFASILFILLFTTNTFTPKTQAQEFLVPLDERVNSGTIPKIGELLGDSYYNELLRNKDTDQNSGQHKKTLYLEDSFLYEPSKYRVLKFSGIESVIVKRMSGYYWTYTQKFFREKFANSNSANYGLNELFLDQQKLGDAENDLNSGGRWWDRSIFDSMEPERGGWSKIPEIIQYGNTIDIIDTKLFSVNNEGKIKLGDISFWFDKQINIKKILGYTGNNANNINNLINGSSTDIESIGLNFTSKSKGNVLTTKNIIVNFRGNVKIRFPNISNEIDFASILSQITSEVEIGFLYKEKKWGRLIFRAEGNPIENRWDFTGNFELLNW